MFGVTAAAADTLDWATRPATNLLTTTDSAVVNGVTIQTSGGRTGTFNPSPPSNGILPTSSANGSGVGVIATQLDALTDDGAATETVTFTFSEPVYNLALVVRDIDGGPSCACNFNDVVTFTSDAGLPTTNTPGSAVAYNAATGTASANTNLGLSDASGNMSVTFAGPVTTATITHVAAAINSSNNPAFQVVIIDDVTYLRSPRLAIRKGYSPAGAATTFNFTVSNSGAGSTATSVTTSGAAVTGTQIRLNALAATTVAETGPAGWIMSGANAACTDSNSANSGNPASFSAPIAGSGLAFTVPAGNVRGGAVITCAITNVAAPRLTLLKTVTNDNGGTNVDTDFMLTATGPTTITGIEGAASVTNAAVNAGTYVLTESGAATAAYTQGAWSCTAGTLTGNSLVLASGQTASCTITNNDRPRLTLLKTVVNNSGGTALDTAFTLTATGPVTISGVEGAAAVTNANVNAGTYALTESSLAGYTASAWSCVGGTLAGANLTLTQAQNATCTITNDDTPATLTLTKIIVNTGGGTAVLANFPLTATGPTTITGVSGTAAVTGAAVSAGTFALSEAALASYTAGAWTCSAGTLSGSNLTLALGQSANCSITNTFVPAPELTIEKTANTAGPLVAGQTVNYTYLVENTGNVTITGVNVIETAFNGSGTPPSPVTGGSTTIAPGQTVTFTAAYVVTQQDVDTLQ